MSKDKNCCHKTVCGCALAGMFFCKHAWKAMILTFIIMMGFEMFWHGPNVMEPMYMETMNLWRTQADFQTMMPWLYAGIALKAVLFTFVFYMGSQGKGIMEGVRFGFYMTLFLGSCYLVSYAVTPYPLEMIGMWFLGTFIEFVIAGAVLAKICNHKK